MQHELNQIGQSSPAGVIAYWIAGACLLSAEVVRNMDHYELPLIVMQLFQIAAWTATFIAATVGTYLSIKNSKRKKKKFYDPN